MLLDIYTLKPHGSPFVASLCRIFGAVFYSFIYFLQYIVFCFLIGVGTAGLISVQLAKHTFANFLHGKTHNAEEMFYTTEEPADAPSRQRKMLASAEKVKLLELKEGRSCAAVGRHDGIK